MKIILTHRSALEYWRMPNRRKPTRQELSRVTVPDDRVPSLRDIEEHPLVRSGELSFPIEVLTASHTKSNRPEHVVHRIRKGPLPHGSLVRIDDATYVVSPELCALQRSSAQKLSASIGLGYELCGKYSLVNEKNGAVGASTAPDGFLPQSRSGFRQRDPLTTPAKLASFAERSMGMHGAKQLKRAAQYVLPHSASPMETTVAAACSSPRLLGGYMLGTPLLNCRVAVGNRAGRDYLRPDLFWPEARLAVEYDSDEHHSHVRNISRDAKRRTRFACKDVMVVTVTYEQLSNYLELDKVAHALARRLGIWLPPRDAKFTRRQIELLSVLLHASSSTI